MNALTKVTLLSCCLSITPAALAEPFNEKYKDDLASVSSDSPLNNYRIERYTPGTSFKERSDTWIAAVGPNQQSTKCAPGEALAYTTPFNDKSIQVEEGPGYLPSGNDDPMVAHSDYVASKKPC